MAIGSIGNVVLLEYGLGNFGFLSFLDFVIGHTAFVPKYNGININTDIAQILPYVVGLVIVRNVRKNKGHHGPAYLGMSYFREER